MSSETAEQRSERGRAMLVESGESLADWGYYHEAWGRLSSSERATFDLEFIKARAVAGVRPAVDIALAGMREKLGRRLGKGSWRAGT